MSLVLFPIFLNELASGSEFSIGDMIISINMMILVVIAIFFLGEAIKYGTAGAAQAIENSKTIL